jgi:hypothetical protein
VFPWLAKNSECGEKQPDIITKMANYTGGMHIPMCTGMADDIHMGGFLGGIALSVTGACLRLKTCLERDLHRKLLEECTLNMEMVKSPCAGFRKLLSKRYQLKFTVNLVITMCITALLVFMQFGIGFAALPERSQWTICTRWGSAETCSGGDVPLSVKETLRTTPQWAQKYNETDGWPCVWNASKMHDINLHRCTDPLCDINYENQSNDFRRNAQSIACEFMLICAWIHISSLSLVASAVLEHNTELLEDIPAWEELPWKEGRGNNENGDSARALMSEDSKQTT